jgi:two-component system alkaline phosphatase synthesis response regulator PhoP
MFMPTILVVEDETSIQNVIRTYLESENFRVVCVDNGSEALTLARELKPDLVILDLMLPGIDGMEVAARLRQESDVYILILTARTEETDRVAGLRIGADDYLTKPFSPRELVARVQAILRRRRSSEPATNTLRFQHLSIDPDRHEVWTPEQAIELTTTEFKVLLELARHTGRVLTREQLIDLVWGMDF